MSYQVFARKYRPRTFADLLGQDHVVRTLRNAIEKDRIAQAYLFVGPRGTGKTSTARILAKALNNPGGPSADFDPDAELCREIAEGRSLDVLEIDGASNNGVDQVRELRETVQYAPAQGRYKIYYIDEVHMLSNAAFNALLKTLEEPPPHVKFIFATTEPHKVLPTIISRCQRFDLRRIPDEIIAAHLLHIAEQEQIALDPAAAAAIARGAEGGMRDAQSMLDQLVAFCGDSIQEADVEEVFGITSWQTVADLARQLLELDSAGALETIRRHHDAGRDLARLLADLIRHWRNLVVWQVDEGRSLPDLDPAQRELLGEQSRLADSEHLLLAADELSATLDRLRWASDPRLQADLGLVRTLRALESVSLDDVLGFLEKRGADPARAPGIRSATSASSSPHAEAETAPRATVPTGPAAVAATPPSALDEDETGSDDLPADAPPATSVEAAPTEPVATDEPALSWDAPLRHALPDADEDQPSEEHYDDSADYGASSMFDLLSSQLGAPAPATRAVPAATPSPAPAPEAEAESIPERLALDDLATFWRRFTHALPAHFGMVADAAAQGQPLSLDGDHLLVGLPPSQQFAFDTLLRQPTAELLARLAAAAGRPLRLEFRIDASVPEPVIPEPEPPVVAKPRKETAATKPTPEPVATGGAPANRFANDPDIERALKIFEAEVLEG